MPCYLIADIGANHDGSLDRALELIKLAADAGANAVKFQHFQADSIVSEFGFKDWQIAHQATWAKPVYNTYKDYSIPDGWTLPLYETAKAYAVDFMSTPYSFRAVDLIKQYVPAYKIGSGDITWLPFLRHVASQGKPVILSTGASNMAEVRAAVTAILDLNHELTLLQCNTNYTGSTSNLKYTNLNVLKTYDASWPVQIGLSDHTLTDTTALGAVALGAKVIEKHFTDDRLRSGPDHPFSILPNEWKIMVARIREMEVALGHEWKLVEDNEREAQIVQRRCLRLTHDHNTIRALQADDFEMLRPAPLGALTDLSTVIGKCLASALPKGREIYPEDLL